MNTEHSLPSSSLPDYIKSATPNPAANRAAWFKNTAPTYAGIFLWFVFWQDAVKSGTPGGGLAAGLPIALLGLLAAALICHFLFYMVPGLLGMKTGLPLYIVGTSTFGAVGGFLMPGFLMGLLQFGWLGVNTYFSSLALSAVIPGVPPQVIMVAWGIMAAFVGLAGIQYVAKVATYLPLIPLVILIVLAVKTISGVGGFSPEKLIADQQAIAATSAVESTAAEAVVAVPASDAAVVADADVTEAIAPAAPAKAPLSTLGVLAFLLTYVVGFFATAGAAGVDFGMSNRNRHDVQMGGLIGIALAILVTAGLSALIVAGVHGDPAMSKAAMGVTGDPLNSKDLMPVIVGADTAKWLGLLLAIAAFPSACFSSFIAANSFKTTLPKVNPFISVGVGAVVAIALALTGAAKDVVGVFVVIGASFGPICGAMMVDYLLAGNRWTGPRAGFNPAGWISWALGFLVGIVPNLKGWGVLPATVPDIPAAPVAAFIVGAVVYFLCMKIGLKTPVVAFDHPESTLA